MFAGSSDLPRRTKSMLSPMLNEDPSNIVPQMISPKALTLLIVASSARSHGRRWSILAGKGAPSSRRSATINDRRTRGPLC